VVKVAWWFSDIAEFYDNRLIIETGSSFKNSFTFHTPMVCARLGCETSEYPDSLRFCILADEGLSA